MSSITAVPVKGAHKKIGEYASSIAAGVMLLAVLLSTAFFMRGLRGRTAEAAPPHVSIGTLEDVSVSPVYQGGGQIHKVLPFDDGKLALFESGHRGVKSSVRLVKGSKLLGSAKFPGLFYDVSLGGGSFLVLDHHNRIFDLTVKGSMRLVADLSTYKMELSRMTYLPRSDRLWVGGSAELPGSEDGETINKIICLSLGEGSILSEGFDLPQRATSIAPSNEGEGVWILTDSHLFYHDGEKLEEVKVPAPKGDQLISVAGNRSNFTLSLSSSCYSYSGGVWKAISASPGAILTQVGRQVYSLDRNYTKVSALTF